MLHGARSRRPNRVELFSLLESVRTTGADHLVSLERKEPLAILYSGAYQVYQSLSCLVPLHSSV